MTALPGVPSAPLRRRSSSAARGRMLRDSPAAWAVSTCAIQFGQRVMFLSAHFGFRRERAWANHAANRSRTERRKSCTPWWTGQGVRGALTAPSGVSKASESQFTESNLTSANGRRQPSPPEAAEIVTNEPGNMAPARDLQDRAAKDDQCDRSCAHFAPGRRRGRPEPEGYPETFTLSRDPSRYPLSDIAANLQPF